MFESLQINIGERMEDWVQRGGAKDTAAALLELGKGDLNNRSFVAMSSLCQSPCSFAFTFTKKQCIMRGFAFQLAKNITVVGEQMGVAIMEALSAAEKTPKRDLMYVDKNPAEANCEKVKERGEAEVLCMVSVLMLANKPQDDPHPQRYTGMTTFSMRDNLKRAITKKVMGFESEKRKKGPAPGPSAPPLTEGDQEDTSSKKRAGDKGKNARKRISFK